MPLRRTLIALAAVSLVAGLAACAGRSAAPTTSAATTSIAAPASVVSMVDSATRLTAGPRPAEPAPDGATVDRTIKGDGTISIDGALPLSLSGGLCSFVGATLFIQAGEISGDSITLSFVTADTSLAAITDPNRISAEQIGWQSSGSMARSVPDTLDIIFDEGGGIFGSFTGTAALTGASATTETIDFHGRFGCTPAPFEVRGRHGLRIDVVRCDPQRGTVSAGGSSGDAALLAFDPAAMALDDPFVDGSLTFRVGTTEYRSTWLLAGIDLDELGGEFSAGVTGPDGESFTVDGGFRCIG